MTKSECRNPGLPEKGKSGIGIFAGSQLGIGIFAGSQLSQSGIKVSPVPLVTD
jgi:hypothetical protein